MCDIGAADEVERLEVFLDSLGAPAVADGMCVSLENAGLGGDTPRSKEGSDSGTLCGKEGSDSGTLRGKEESDERLRKLRAEARAEGIPIIRPAAERYIRTQLAILRPHRILEVGTAVGYSAIVMAACSPEADITTIENYAPRIEAARRNFTDFGLESRVRLIEADAEDALRKLSDDGAQYDLIFLDAAKGQYIALLPYIDRLLREGGVLITDNCLQDGSVIDSRYAVRRRDRTIHKRMREYLSALWRDERYLCDLLPVGDGVAVAVKKEHPDTYEK